MTVPPLPSGQISRLSLDAPHYTDPRPEARIAMRQWVQATFGEPHPELAARTEIRHTPTIARLEAAHRTNWTVKQLLYYGAGNSKIDNQGTLGAAWARVKLQKYRGFNWVGTTHDAQINKIHEVVRYQAGNCGEASAVTFGLLASMNLNAPVMRVKAEGIDHAFVIIGDPRVENKGRIAVADAWPQAPMGHTLRDGKFQVGKTIWAHPPNTPYPLDVDALHTLVTVAPAEIDLLTTKRWGAPVGPTLVERAQCDPLMKLYDQAISITSSAIEYALPNGPVVASLNDMPFSYAQSQERRIKRVLDLAARQPSRDPGPLSPR